MEIKVGIKQVSREIVVESNQTTAEVEKAVAKAIDRNEVLTLTDTHGRRVLIAGGSIGYVDIGEESARRVGFGSG
ncbi:hypothetical protein MLP_32220 [Microlunatus phosphovorus NM-1]|uniref:ATP-binding protein n=1 Tax=Microlunatus phosphovorus (strain ATCC 700054 / DSM 10555 / JCM 9379 / NBRC 101784 / NCIMB 13414 / VKM Ac-1990 / NM-1) TaxID=1032480 RepID=F5XLH0_MICPN|nr:DUF3107 domain-containing protein [Microlunatus phosphovorus]BAK36236.1 hypothetical protein MLP_32220 [Microlunatus phosphovorus NM-1]